MITYTVLGVPYDNYIIMRPQNPILLIKAPILRLWGLGCRSLEVVGGA